VTKHLHITTCTSTGIGCMLSPSNTCFLSEQVSLRQGIMIRTNLSEPSAS
jgi:hypothetical protein